MHPFAQIGAWTDAGQAHLVHMTGDGLVIDHYSFAPQLSGDPPHAVIRPLGVDFIDPMLEGDLLWRWRH